MLTVTCIGADAVLSTFSPSGGGVLLSVPVNGVVKLDAPLPGTVLEMKDARNSEEVRAVGNAGRFLVSSKTKLLLFKLVTAWKFVSHSGLECFSIDPRTESFMSDVQVLIGQA